MKLLVKYFGIVADKTGLLKEVIELNEGLTSDEFMMVLKKKYDLADTVVSLAVNRKIARKPQKLVEGDELALLPPFAGG